MDRVAVAKRPRFLFDRPRVERMAMAVADRLAPRKVVCRLLSESVDRAYAPQYHVFRSIRYSNNWWAILGEI
jgi:hypothetical protein